jgi:hypothetical protein
LNVPESKTRFAADEKKKAKRRSETAKVRAEKAQAPKIGERRWVPPLFISCAILGVAWMVVSNVAGYSIPFMAALGNWNMLIGMGLLALAFVLMTLWK